MAQSNFLYFIVLIAIIVYQQYSIYTLYQASVSQGEVVQALVKQLEFIAPSYDSKVIGVEYINVANNQFLHIRSPAPKASPPARAEVNRDIYGGKGDAVHLGGFTARDNQTISENLWNFMLSQLAVKSIVDVGCGKGFSTSYFLKKGARILCIEGSKDAIANSLLPSNLIIEHDFSRGPWWPKETFDVAWSTEFLEHVGRQYMKNYLPVFAKSALIFVTASGWGGWHHVEVHDQKWWIGRMQSHGFIYSEELTSWIRKQAQCDLTGDAAQTLAYGLNVQLNLSLPLPSFDLT